MATILGNWYARIKGGWRTVGAPGGPGAFDSNTDWSPDAVAASTAMKLSAYFACVRLLSETMGSMQFQLKDKQNRAVNDHDVYDLMQTPSSLQTGDSFVGAMTANKSVFGNGLAHIKRMQSTGRAYALDFYATELWEVDRDGRGVPTFRLDGEKVPSEDVLHWPGFSVNGFWGLPTLVAGASVLAMQTQSNNAAQQTFKSGLRAGGFFKFPENRQAFSTEQLEKFKEELTKMALPQNTNKWLPLLPGMEPVANTQYKIDPVSAELLQSRYFGIEEICRFMGVPPPLIGHTDKASSWASSIEGLNQFLKTYTVLPQAVRFENEIGRKLLGRNERGRLTPKFNMDSLDRADLQKRFESYDIGISTGIYCPNDAREKEGEPSRPGGDVYVTPTAGRNKQQGTGS